jgi:hypothetical protein
MVVSAQVRDGATQFVSEDLYLAPRFEWQAIV